MEKKSFKGLLKKVVVCVMCTLTLAGVGIGLSGCITTKPKDPIKETKNVTIETVMNAPTDIAFVDAGNGNVKIVWNNEKTDNVKADETIKFTVKHEGGESVVEGNEITIAENQIDESAVNIKTNAASSYAGADKVEEDKENNKVITTKTTYSFSDSAETSASYQKEDEKQEIQLAPPSSFEITEEGILKFAVDAKAKEFDIFFTVDGIKQVFENQEIADASKGASYKIANYDKTKEYTFAVELNGYVDGKTTYLDSARGTFTKEAEQVKDISFEEFTDKLVPKIEKDIWQGSKILEVYALERKGTDLRVFLKSTNANGISYKEYGASFSESIEGKTLSKIAAGWEKNDTIKFREISNFTTSNPALSETYKNNETLSLEIRAILNKATILMESTGAPDYSGNITSTILVKNDGNVYKLKISSSATINHGDLKKYMKEAQEGTNRTGFKETTETLSNAITAESASEKTETSAVQPFKFAKAVNKQVKSLCM